MHSCCHILLIVLTRFNPKAKKIQKHLKMDLENQIEKKNKKHFTPFLLFGLSAHSSEPARVTPHRPAGLLPFFPPRFLSWAGPFRSWTTARALSFL
jgi:hypothetical protein